MSTDAPVSFAEMCKIHVVSKSFIIFLKFVHQMMAGVLTQHWWGLPGYLTGTQTLSLICWDTAESTCTCTQTYKLFTHWPTLCCHTLLNSPCTCLHNILHWFRMCKVIIRGKKKTLPSFFFPEVSGRGSVSRPVLARSKRSAFMALCHPKLEVSAEQKVRHKTDMKTFTLWHIFSCEKNEAYH